MEKAFSDICQREIRRQQEERGAYETKKSFNDTKCEILQKDSLIISVQKH
jgi:hypothetical protein